MTCFQISGRYLVFAVDEARHFKFCTHIHHAEYIYRILCMLITAKGGMLDHMILYIFVNI